MSHAFRSFDDLEPLTRALSRTLSEVPQPTYLSIDKDVFATDVVQTNWDQGQMREAQAARIIQSLTGQLTGSDITGDISSWRYATWWKRLLSAGDGQSTRMSPAQSWQRRPGSTGSPRGFSSIWLRPVRKQAGSQR